MKRNNEVQVISCTFQHLLDAHLKGVRILNSDIKGKLNIPEYQRPYVWTEKQINRLLNDLSDYQQRDETDKPMFYLGSIILHQDDDKLNIIDGQQRITTMLMLGKLQSPEFQTGLEYKTSTSVQNIKKNLSYLYAIKQKEIYEYKHYNIIENLDFSQINITLVITPTEDLAYTFFETQNTGGIRLSGSDIVKAHHLRAINSKKVVNYQARRWEQMESDKVEHIMQYLSKIRYWDNRHWRRFPFYRDTRGIKSELLDEFTERTLKTGEDISYHYSAVKFENGRQLQMYESHYKQLKQPLWDGNNSMDYINEYINLFDLLFNYEKRDHRVPDSFYEFVEKLMHGHSGTIFLKELLEISIITYVSRFGFHRITESALWLYRLIYSLRVSVSRNVREDSVFKLVYDNQLIDNILEVFTVEQLHDYLKRFTYSFNTDNTEKNQSKDRHIQTLIDFFGGDHINEIQHYTSNPKQFDQDLTIAVSNKINLQDD
ncbi:DUF262 domain-containing protein [Salinimicrobium gaetbulicola]|uniref:DUF262 domain-containing protein n=1 Tax=Salinimicrobium gaetbulicola TaxID=999702 RepID=A0ABW3IG13_9FLAO